jgi:hypothetical protein
VIRYPVTQSCTLYRLERRTGREPFLLVEEFDPFKYDGLYPDEDLQNNVQYIYRLTCLGASGEGSEPSNEFEGTPREDPLPPTGNVSIERGRPYVSSPAIMLQFTADEDTLEMRVSNDAAFAGASWQPFQTALPWQIAPNASGYAIVFAMFRDRVGNESISKAPQA